MAGQEVDPQNLTPGVMELHQSAKKEEALEAEPECASYSTLVVVVGPFKETLRGC